MLGACGTEPTKVDYNGHSYDELNSELYNNVNMVQQLDLLFEQNGIKADEVPEEVSESLSANYGVTPQQIEAAAKWADTIEEFGEFQEIEESSFKVTKSGKTLTTDVQLKFEKKDVVFQVVYDYYSMDITGISVDPVYSLGEKMAKAGMNTLISISIVFAVLILISLLIACFKIFPYLEQRKTKKKEAEAPAVEDIPAEAQAEAPVVQQADDTELIAVIAAAIAADTGTSTSDFVVRSINRR